ncbi:MAG TPA: molybdopterin cofactor-binding domain-containing protein [Stellaceae bacterium]|nr:molybdopterin cofactor-binding domain-containing protein [Stellaceae bacterium]
MSDVAVHPEVRNRFPVIAEALLFSASGQLRNMASIGGNIMQRTRCAYFRDEDDLPCNKRRPGSGCAARHGLNRNHAIFGWSDGCVATNPSDLAVALAALDAQVIVRGASGERSIAFAEFHRLPGTTPETETVLKRGDLIVAIEVPPRPEGRASHYLNLGVTYAELLARNGLPHLIGDGSYDPVPEAEGAKAIFSFSAVYAEVRVDPELGLVRLQRFVGAYDAGRIINPKTARSQAIGGIIWGVGQALLEQSETDPALGRFLNRNYSGYLVPSNADIPDPDAHFVGDFDAEASPLGAKGLGELTAVSVAPAIANAVYHATGKRVRDLPITVEKVM